MSTLLDLGLSNALMATLLAVLVAGVAAVCRRPALTHSLWLLVLCKLITPAFVSLPLTWPAFGEAVEVVWKFSARVAEPSEDVEPMETSGAAPDQEAGPGPSPAEANPSAPLPEAVASASGWFAGSWRESVGLLWLASSGLWFTWTLWHIGRFQRLLRHAQPAPAELQARAQRLAKRLGLGRCPPVCLVPGTVGPMVWAIGGAPRLLLPSRLLESLDAEQQATVLVHELAHVRRRDHWVRLVELVVSGLYWWHPVVWWARQQVHEAEEQCCDAWVVWALDGVGRTYALALLQTVAFVSQTRWPLPVTASGIGQVPHLRRRLTMIVQGRTSKSLSWAGWLVVLGLGLFLLPLSPLQAEPLPQEQAEKGASKQEARDAKIQALKKALQDLEAQQRADQREEGDAKKGDAATVQKARHEVEILTKLIDAKRRELQSMEVMLQALKAKLATQLPKTAGDQEEVRREIKAKKDFARDGKPATKPGPGELPGVTPDKEIGQLAQKLFQLRLDRVKQGLDDQALAKDKALAQVRKQLAEELAQAKPKDVQPKPKADFQSKEKRPADVEQKLDQLLKEVEELRREIRREKR